MKRKDKNQEPLIISRSNIKLGTNGDEYTKIKNRKEIILESILLKLLKG